MLATADVVVAAVGRPQFVKGEWIREGAIVIDVAVLDELRAAAAPRDAKTCGDEPIKCETKDTKKM